MIQPLQRDREPGQVDQLATSWEPTARAVVPPVPREAPAVDRFGIGLRKAVLLGLVFWVVVTVVVVLLARMVG